jgi:hypothetical protein
MEKSYILIDKLKWDMILGAVASMKLQIIQLENIVKSAKKEETQKC